MGKSLNSWHLERQVCSRPQGKEHLGLILSINHIVLKLMPSLVLGIQIWYTKSKTNPKVGRVSLLKLKLKLKVRARKY